MATNFPYNEGVASNEVSEGVASLKKQFIASVSSRPSIWNKLFAAANTPASTIRKKNPHWQIRH
jgi:hypothetical protein